MIITGISCLLAVSFFLFSIHRVSDIYLGKTQETILNMKKDFLKDTVNNLISEIDRERGIQAQDLQRQVENASAMLELKLSLSYEDFSQYFIGFFENDQEYDFWTVLLWDKQTNRPLYDSQSRAEATWEQTLEGLQGDLAIYGLVTHEEVSGIFGVSQNVIDGLVKNAIADTMRSIKFDDGSYIWVNEILNYEGGKDYAIRRVHPNLIETEGMYLSTDMTDIKGNFPYQVELDGINEKGELFFTYFFKELSSDTISEKLTYAKLYPDFDWVIAMGIYLNDLAIYADHANAESKALVSRLTLILVFLFLIILLLSYAMIVLIEKRSNRHTQKMLESEVNQDTLTKAGSRRSGSNDLNHAFQAFRRNGDNAAVMMLDVDYFKRINDTYGHGVGDQVLIEIVQAILSVIRSTDKLIRWGGDEFIIIFYGLHKSNAPVFGKTILSLASSLEIPTETGVISPTLSIGVSYFEETDTDYHDVLKRADQALYQSKTNGRNQVTLE